MRHHRLTTVVALAYLVALLLVVFWPSHVDDGIDVVNWWSVQWLGDLLGLNPLQRYKLVEFGSNVILFIPLGLVASRQLRNRPLVVPVIGGLLVSACVELGQLILRLDRTPSISDVLANTLGAAIGVALHRAISVRHLARTT